MKTCHKEFFQNHGLKNTPSRDAVFHLLDSQLMTAEQLYQQLTEDGYTLSFSTVYRILEKFLEKNIIEVVKFQNETSVYYQVTWSPEKGKIKNRQWSVRKYGEEEAFRRAKAFRESVMVHIYGEDYLNQIKDRLDQKGMEMVHPDEVTPPTSGEGK
jgi:DNA-binding PadR family transcriptional regulator